MYDFVNNFKETHLNSDTLQQASLLHENLSQLKMAHMFTDPARIFLTVLTSMVLHSGTVKCVSILHNDVTTRVLGGILGGGGTSCLYLHAIRSRPKVGVYIPVTLKFLPGGGPVLPHAHVWMSLQSPTLFPGIGQKSAIKHQHFSLFEWFRKNFLKKSIIWRVFNPARFRSAWEFSQFCQYYWRCYCQR